MSYIKKIEKDYNDNFISLSKLSQLRETYLASSKEERNELDDNSLSEEERKEIKNKPLEGNSTPSIPLHDNAIDLSEINANILSIKNNVSFFFWLSVCSFVISIFVVLVSLA